MRSYNISQIRFWDSEKQPDLPTTLIFLYGSLLLLSAGYYHLIYEIGRVNGLTGPVLALLLDGGLAVAIIALGVALIRSDYTRADRITFASFGFGGGAAFVFAILGTIGVRLIEGRSVPETFLIVVTSLEAGFLSGAVMANYRVQASQKRRELARNRDALEQMYQITTNQSLSSQQKINTLLEIGTDYLNLEYGFVTEIEAAEATQKVQTITHAHGTHSGLQPGETCPLPESYCRKTLEQDGLFTIQNATELGWEDDAAYERFSLESYIGGAIQVTDQTHGTVCFAASSAREQPFTPTEKSFVDLLGRWVSYEIDREVAYTELSEEREQLRLLVDSLDEYAFITLDDDGRIQTWNDGARSLFGHEPTDAMGLSASTLLSTGNRNRLTERLLEQARISGESSHEGWCARDDDTQFYASVRYASLNDGNDGFRGYAMVVRDMTDARRRRRRTERFVEKSQEVVTIVDTDGEVTYASEAADHVLDYNPDTLLNENLFDYVHPDDRKAVIESFYAAIDQENSDVEIECRFRMPDGEWRYLEIYCRNLLDDDAIGGMLLYLRDVTKTKERIRRFEAIFNQTFQFTGLIDSDGTVIEANKSALEFGGIERDEIVGEQFSDALWWSHSETAPDQIQDAISRAKNGEFVRYETKARGADGLVTIDFSLKPIFDDDDEVIMLVAEGRDISLQQYRNQHLAVIQRVFRHNVRNDVNKLHGWTEMITEEPDPATRREHFERVNRILSDWDSLTDRVKEIRQVLRTKPDMEPKANLTNLIVDAVTTVRGRYDSTTIDTDLQDGSVEVPRTVGNAVEELLVNAANVTDEGSLEVVSTTSGDGWINIEVCDDGPGLPDIETEVLEGGEETPLVHGQGLGLWMVRMIIIQAGGSVSVDKSGEGTSICLRLPINVGKPISTPDLTAE
jgi:PAS domain S-box-containing protein